VVEGNYRAVFSAVYAKGNRPQAEGKAFLLDISPPEIEIDIHPLPFTPDNDGVDDDLTIAISASDSSLIENWSAIIRDAGGTAFASYSGEGKPSSAIIWEGRSDSGELVVGGTNYTVDFRIGDVLGNEAQARRTITIGLLILRREDTLRITLASQPPSASSSEAPAEDLASLGLSSDLLQHLADLLNRYAAYSIRIEGHAGRHVGAQRRELSLRWAEEAKTMLANMGVDSARMTVIGLGDARPLYPAADDENSWKNTRIEIVLTK
jgi:hypothetical protein